MLTIAMAMPLLQVSFGGVCGMSTGMRVILAVQIFCILAPNGLSRLAIDNTGDKMAVKIETAQEICTGDKQLEKCTTP